MITPLIGHLLAVCIGLSLGLLGGGGSILAVPILVYVMGVNSKVAIAMSLFIVGSVSLLGVIPYARHGRVSWRIAAGFIPTAMLGAYLGTQLIRLPLITETVQLVSFGLVMLAASILMIRRGRRSVKPQSAQPQDAAAQPSVSWLILLEGLGVGIVTGFVGVGGGFLIIPALVLLGGVPIKTAVGTSLLIIAFNSATGFLGYLTQVSIDWGLTLPFTLAAGLGTLLGSRLSRIVSAEQLQKGFGYFVLAVAIFVLIRR
ncbi:MAG: sulfite exporter TauE/SafE family protein [Cyanobacteria bacterium J06627_15]